MPSMKLLFLPAIPAAIAVIAIATDDGKASAPKHEAHRYTRHYDHDLERNTREYERERGHDRDLDVVPPPSPVKPADPCGPGGCAAA